MTIKGYELEALVGEGGTSLVYRARQLSLDRIVAIKILKPEGELDPVIRQRFIHGGKLAAKISSPHSIVVYETGIEEGDNGETHFISTELLFPETLEQKITKGMPTKAGLKAFLQLCEGLEAAHLQSVVHGDIKPQNVLFRKEGQAVLIDYLGLLPEGSTSLGGHQAPAVGSPAYMSPEQARGRSASVLSDIYSMGILLFQILTSRKPFVADTVMETAHLHLTAPVPPLPKEVRHFSVLINRVMAKDPAHRYPSISLVRADLEYIVAAFAVEDTEKTQVLPSLHEGDEEFLSRLLGDEIASLKLATAPVPKEMEHASLSSASAQGREALAEPDTLGPDDTFVEPHEETPSKQDDLRGKAEQGSEVDLSPTLNLAAEELDLKGYEYTQESTADTYVELDSPTVPDIPKPDVQREEDVDSTRVRPLSWDTKDSPSVSHREAPLALITEEPPIHSFSEYRTTKRSTAGERSAKGTSWKAGLLWAAAASVVTATVILNISSSPEGSDSAKSSSAFATPHPDEVIESNTSVENGISNIPGHLLPSLVTVTLPPNPVLSASEVRGSEVDVEGQEKSVIERPSAREKSASSEQVTPPDVIGSEEGLRLVLKNLVDAGLEIRQGKLMISRQLSQALDSQGIANKALEDGRLVLTLPSQEGYFPGVARLDERSIASLQRAAYVFRNFSGFDIELQDQRFVEEDRSLQYGDTIKKFLVDEGVSSHRVHVKKNEFDLSVQSLQLVLFPSL